MPSIKAKWVRPATDLPFAEGVLCLNSSGAPILAGDLVFVSGASGSALTVQGTDAATAPHIFGALFVAKHAVPNGRRGVMLPWVHVVGINTGPGAVGDAIYVADAPAVGGWSLTQGTNVRRVGTVTNASATVGSVFLNPQAYDQTPTGWFKSAPIVGNTAAQSTAHGLGKVPNLVIVVPADTNGTQMDIVEGAHDATHAIVTAAAGVIYRVIAV